MVYMIWFMNGFGSTITSWYIVDIRNMVSRVLCTCFLRKLKDVFVEAVRKFRPFEGFFGFLDL